MIYFTHHTNQEGFLMRQSSKGLTCLVVASCILVSSNAYARDNRPVPFTGLGVGVALSAVKNTLSLSTTTLDFGASSTEVSFIGSYGLAMTKNWVGTLGLSVGLKISDYGTEVVNGISNYAAARNHLALSFAPGYRIDNENLLYGKVAMHSMDVDYSTSAGFAKSLTHQGMGVGFGYAILVSRNLELRAELESIQFDVQTSNGIPPSKPKQSDFNIGLVYKF